MIAGFDGTADFVRSVAELREQVAEARAEGESGVEGGGCESACCCKRAGIGSQDARVEEELDMLQSRAVVDMKIHERCIAGRALGDPHKRTDRRAGRLRATFAEQKDQ